MRSTFKRCSSTWSRPPHCERLRHSSQREKFSTAVSPGVRRRCRSDPLHAAGRCLCRLKVSLTISEMFMLYIAPSRATYKDAVVEDIDK